MNNTFSAEKLNTIPAGEYYIGDPYNIFKNNSGFYSFIESIDTSNGCGISFKNKTFYLFDTSDETGSYSLMNKNIKNITINNGMIAVIPIELIETLRKNVNSDSIVFVDTEATFDYWNGNLVIINKRSKKRIFCIESKEEVVQEDAQEDFIENEMTEELMHIYSSDEYDVYNIY